LYSYKEKEEKKKRKKKQPREEKTMTNAISPKYPRVRRRGKRHGYHRAKPQCIEIGRKTE